MELYSLLNSIISIIPFLMMYRFVYRNWFRFDLRIAMFLFILLYFLEYVYLSRIEISGINRAWIHVLLYVIPLTFFRKEMVTRAMILDVFFNFLYNVIGVVIMLLLVSGYDLLSGTENQTWMAVDYNTRTDYLFRYLMMPAAGGVSCFITYKVMPLLEKLTKGERLWIGLGLVGTTEGYVVFTRLAIKGIDDYYGGIVVICYGLALLLMGSICVFWVLITAIRINAERREMQYQMRLQREKYEEIRQVQDGVRELRHDLVNHLAAGTLSKETARGLMDECRKKCLWEGKDDGAL